MISYIQREDYFVLGTRLKKYRKAKFMLVVNILVILMFIALGITFATGRGVDLVAGYNTMPKDEKEKINKEALCKYMSRLMFILAGCWAVLGVGVEIEKMWLFWCGFGLFIAVTIFFAIFLNTGNRLDKND